VNKLKSYKNREKHEYTKEKPKCEEKHQMTAHKSL